MKPGRGLLNGSVIPDVPHTFERETSYDSNNSTEQYNVTSLKDPSSEYNEEISETSWNNEKLIKEEISETSWNNEELYRVLYQCNNDLLTGGDGGSKHYRECVNGGWNGETPECGESNFKRLWVNQ